MTVKRSESLTTALIVSDQLRMLIEKDDLDDGVIHVQGCMYGHGDRGLLFTHAPHQQDRVWLHAVVYVHDTTNRIIVEFGVTVPNHLTPSVKLIDLADLGIGSYILTREEFESPDNAYRVSFPWQRTDLAASLLCDLFYEEDIELSRYYLPYL